MEDRRRKSGTEYSTPIPLDLLASSDQVSVGFAASAKEVTVAKSSALTTLYDYVVGTLKSAVDACAKDTTVAKDATVAKDDTVAKEATVAKDATVAKAVDVSPLPNFAKGVVLPTLPVAWETNPTNLLNIVDGNPATSSTGVVALGTTREVRLDYIAPVHVTTLYYKTYVTQDSGAKISLEVSLNGTTWWTLMSEELASAQGYRTSSVGPFYARFVRWVIIAGTGGCAIEIYQLDGYLKG